MNAELSKTTANPQLETLIAALCLRSAEAVSAANTTLKPWDFTQRPLKLIYEAIQQVRADGSSANPVTVIAQLTLRDKLDDVGGAEFVTRLASEPVDGTASEVPSYCKSLKDFSYRRRLRYLAKQLLGLSEEPEDNAEISSKARDLMRLAEDDTTPEDVLLNPGQIVEQVSMDKLLNPMLGQKVMDTPWLLWNDLTIGYFQSTLNIIGARPSCGKSALAAQILLHNAKKGIPCAFFSIEMKREAILRRLLCGMTNISLRKFYKNELTKEERQEISQAHALIKDIPLLISNLYGRTTVQIDHAIRQAQVALGPLGMVAIDHLQLMRPMRKHNNRHGEIGEITSTLKVMSGEFDTRIMLLSQLSRAGKERAEQRPTLTDLKESGDIEQDADTVALLHRPEMYKPDGDKSRTELYAAKARDGELGMVNLRFEGKYTTFYDAD
jgi:replicative DNA helicase